MNLLLTSRCNRSCTFCFAAEEVSLAGKRGVPAHDRWAMDLGTVDRLIDLHRRSNLQHMSLLGGEPTIHPEFCAIVDRILDAGLSIKLFTGGLIPDRVKHHLRQVDPARLAILVNLSAAADCRNQAEYDRTTATVRELHEHCAVGYTITRPDFDARFLVDLVQAADCRRVIRLGLALPMLTDPNPCLEPTGYRATARTILELARYADARDVSLGFDCGFVMCMFTAEELGWLQILNCETTFRCTPILDVNPEEEVFHCFAVGPLLRRRLDEPGEATATRADLERYFGDRVRGYRSFGVYERCTDCTQKRRGQCGGGCLSFVVREFQGSGFESAASPASR